MLVPAAAGRHRSKPLNEPCLTVRIIAHNALSKAEGLVLDRPCVADDRGQTAVRLQSVEWRHPLVSGDFCVADADPERLRGNTSGSLHEST